MLIKAVQKYTRQTPRKVRLVANQVKDLSLQEAINQLGVIEKRATEVIGKTIKQAMSDAVHNHGYQVSDLSIDSILVTEGPRYRRFRAVSRGRAHGIIKRTCHVTVILKTQDDAKASKVAEADAPKDITATEAEIMAAEAQSAESATSTGANLKQVGNMNKADKVASRKVTNRKVITGK